MDAAPATPAATAPTPSAFAEVAPARAEALSRAYIDEELARMARYQAWADDMAERVWRRATEQPAGAHAPLHTEAEAPPPSPEACPAPPSETLTDTAAAPSSSFGGDLSLAFHRITRAACISGARRAAMIEALRRLESGEAPFARRATVPAAATGAGTAAAGSGIAPRHPPLTADEACKAAIEASIRALADLEHPDDPQAAQRLFEEAHARLHADERLGDVAGRPISATIGDLWAALGRAPDWPAVADAAWASEAEAWSHTGALRVTVVHGPRHAEPPSLGPSSSPPGRPPLRPAEPRGTPELGAAPPDLPPAPPPTSPPTWRQTAPSEPTWLPGEGPPPRQRRSRPYWEAPS